MKSFLHLIIGPMFAGKSSELIRRIRRFQVAGSRVLLVNHLLDDRYTEGGFVVTHDHIKMPAVSTNDLSSIDVSNVDCIGIDEGQFFQNIVPMVLMWLQQHAITIIIAALDGTFEQKPFGQLLELIPHADKVKKMSAVCRVCNADAAFTHRLSNTSNTIEIGGADQYQPLCRHCLLKNFNVDRLNL